jgi:hypothetical protein
MSKLKTTQQLHLKPRSGIFTCTGRYLAELRNACAQTCKSSRHLFLTFSWGELLTNSCICSMYDLVPISSWIRLPQFFTADSRTFGGHVILIIQSARSEWIILGGRTWQREDWHGKFSSWSQWEHISPCNKSTVLRVIIYFALWIRSAQHLRNITLAYQVAYLDDSWPIGFQS